MVNNASTGGTKCTGKVHEMEEKTWDLVRYATAMRAIK